MQTATPCPQWFNSTINTWKNQVSTQLYICTHMELKTNNIILKMKKWTVPSIELHACFRRMQWPLMTHFCLGMIRKSCILQKSYMLWNYLFSSWLLLANTNKNQTKKVVSAVEKRQKMGRGRGKGWRAWRESCLWQSAIPLLCSDQ